MGFFSRTRFLLYCKEVHSLMNNAILLLTHSCTPFTEEKKKNSQRHFFKKYIYPQQDHPEIWHNKSSFQLGQTGRRSGQAVIKSQIKHSLTHGSCTFHECRNANIFLTRHQELVHGIYAWAFIFPRKNHTVMKSHHPETGPSAEFISDKIKSSIIRSSLIKTS